MKPLIEHGYVYLAQPPLFQIIHGSRKKEPFYAFSDAERIRIIASLPEDRKIDVQRFKGLGEMDADQLWNTTMDPQRRTLKQVRLEDAAAAEEMFTVLMGDDVAARRTFIQANARNATIDV
jgi:DNA gyrase subunit B